MGLPGVIRGELESVRDGKELVGRFRRFLDPDLGFATREEVAALSEYLSRVDGLVHALEQAADDPVYVVRTVSPEMLVGAFSDADLAEKMARQKLGHYGKLSKDKDSAGRVRLFLGEGVGRLGIAVIDVLRMDENVG